VFISRRLLGYVYHNNGSGNDSIDAASESFLFWQHLALAEIIPGTYTGLVGSSPDYVVPGVNVPTTRITGGGYISRKSGAPITKNITFLSVGKPRPSVPQVSGALFTTAEAKSIDKKIDDGVANTGRLFGFGNHDGTSCTGVNWEHTTGQDYVLSNTGLSCQLRLLIE
jgi:hypothetical protein